MSCLRQIVPNKKQSIPKTQKEKMKPYPKIYAQIMSILNKYNLWNKIINLCSSSALVLSIWIPWSSFLLGLLGSVFSVSVKDMPFEKLEWPGK